MCYPYFPTSHWQGSEARHCFCMTEYRFLTRTRRFVHVTFHRLLPLFFPCNMNGARYLFCHLQRFMYSFFSCKKILPTRNHTGLGQPYFFSPHSCMQLPGMGEKIHRQCVPDSCRFLPHLFWILCWKHHLTILSNSFMTVSAQTNDGCLAWNLWKTCTIYLHLSLKVVFMAVIYGLIAVFAWFRWFSLSCLYLYLCFSFCLLKTVLLRLGLQSGMRVLVCYSFDNGQASAFAGTWLSVGCPPSTSFMSPLCGNFHLK